MKIVRKKILSEYFAEAEAGNKRFELRKDEDNIQVGDIMILREWEGERYTGKQIETCVTYVLRHVPAYGLMEGYCIIGFKTASEA